MGEVECRVEFPAWMQAIFSRGVLTSSYIILHHLHPTNRFPVVPARGGAEVAFGIYYKPFFIYRTCMRRAPARPLRACILRKLCPVSHVTCEALLRTQDP